MKCERLLCKVVDALWSYDAPPPAPPPPPAEPSLWTLAIAVGITFIIWVASRWLNKAGRP